jgi:hypothetical protein
MFNRPRASGSEALGIFVGIAAGVGAILLGADTSVGIVCGFAAFIATWAIVRAAGFGRGTIVYDTGLTDEQLPPDSPVRDHAVHPKPPTDLR